MENTAGDIRTGSLYFYIHFVTEVICFFLLFSYMQRAAFVWMVFLAYDMLAFVPQGVIGYFSDRHPRVPLGVIGLLLLALAPALAQWTADPVCWLPVLCLGNAFTHVNGAEATLRTANGRLFPSALFVSGGSFGLITGKLLAGTALPWPVLVLLALSAVPAAVAAQRRYTAGDAPERPCAGFDLVRADIRPAAAVLLAVFVVAVRGHMGYGIPTTWIKTTVQTASLYIAMGLGKALGGFCADRLGARRTALISIGASLPFLICGDRYMWISLLGVLLFSMTMSITLGVLVSVLPQTPGLAFGLTTIGLFLGTAPMFFFRFQTLLLNGVEIAVCTCLSLLCMQRVLKGGPTHEQREQCEDTGERRLPAAG